jgi:hypothetical protein
VLVRHPAAVVASFKRLGWRHRFASFLEQPLLMDRYLRPYEEEIRAAASGHWSVVEEATLLWRLVHHTVLSYRDRHPDWLLRRHEDLSREPLAEFEDLYARLGLELTPEARGGIEAHSAPSNPAELEQAHSVRLASGESLGAWSRVLTSAEVERVRAAVADVAPAFYGDVDW